MLPVGLLAGAILAVASIAARFRRGGATERAQVKWLLAAVALCAVLLPPSFIDDNGPSGFSLLDTLAMASLALVPLSVGVAVTRYRLYEIDRLISRTIGWAVVTVVLAVVFVGLVVLLQAILAPVTRENTLAVAASTLVALGLFGPLRRAVQRAVDRRFDRARYDARTTTALFVDRVRNEVDLGRLRAELVATATDAVRPTAAGLWLRAGGRAVSPRGREETPLPVPARVALLAGLVAALALPVPDAFTVVFFACHATVGFLLVVRRPRNAIGWLLIVIAFGFVATGSLTDVDLDALTNGTASWADFLRAWLSSWAGSATFVAYLALAVLYPTGRFGDGRERVGKLLVGLGVASVVAQALVPTFLVNPEGTRSYLVPNRFGVLPDVLAAVGLTGEWWTILTIALLVAAAIDLVVRFRRSTGIVRVQMRWLVASLCAIVASIVVALVVTVLLGESGAELAWLPVIVAYPTLPLAVYIAISRYRLYEIDRIVSRTVGWAVITGLLARGVRGRRRLAPGAPLRVHAGPDARRRRLDRPGVRPVPAGAAAGAADGGSPVRSGAL